MFVPVCHVYEYQLSGLALLRVIIITLEFIITINFYIILLVPDIYDIQQILWLLWFVNTATNAASSVLLLAICFFLARLVLHPNFYIPTIDVY